MSEIEKKQEKKKKNRVLKFDMAMSSTVTGSDTSFTNDQKHQLEATAIGVKVVSTKDKKKRVALIPYGNIKGIELYPEDEIE